MPTCAQSILEEIVALSKAGMRRLKIAETLSGMSERSVYCACWALDERGLASLMR